MAKVLDYGLKISEFEFLSRSYIPFRTNTYGKGMHHLILPAAMGWIVLQLFFHKNGFGIKYPRR